MNRSYRWYVGMALLLGHLLAAVVGVLAWAYWQSAPVHQFHRAREHWAEQAVPRYRLVIDRPLLNCQQNMEVREERIVPDSGHNTCPIRSLTVTDLFNRIATLDGSENFEFFTDNGCTCKSILHATVTYDPQLGYPVEVGISDVREINWHESSCLQYIVTHGKLPDCHTNMPVAPPRLTHISLMPLP